jgi:hypothetical protein
MKLELQDYLQAQKRAPFKAVLVNDNKPCLVIAKELTFRNKIYHGPNPRVWHSVGDQIELPASEAKRLRHEYKVQVLGTDYLSGSWDHYRITIDQKEFDAFRPWDSLPRDYPNVPHLDPTEYDDCWIPTRSRKSGALGPLIFLPFGLVQRLPLENDPKAYLSTMVISLPWDAPSLSRHRPRPGAYA